MNILCFNQAVSGHCFKAIISHEGCSPPGKRLLPILVGSSALFSYPPMCLQITPWAQQLLKGMPLSTLSQLLLADDLNFCCPENTWPNRRKMSLQNLIQTLLPITTLTPTPMPLALITWDLTVLNRVLAKGRRAIDGGVVVIQLKSATALSFVPSLISLPVL